MSVSRYKAREQAFIVLFEAIFRKEPVAEIIELAEQSRELVPDEFAKKLVFGVTEKLEEIDPLIEKFSDNWSKNRISKVSLSILRLSIYEILYVEDVSSSVAINEAVDLAKKFATVEDSSFINGLLGMLVRNMELEGQ